MIQAYKEAEEAEDMTEIKKEAGPEELSDEKIEKTIGGRLFSTYYADEIAYEIGQVFDGLNRID